MMASSGHPASDPYAGQSPLLQCDLQPVVDWISLDVTLPSPSQHRHVLDRLNAAALHVTYAQPLDKSESSLRFRLRVQDPLGPDAVLSGLQQALGVVEQDITVQGIEIALDAYARQADLVEVAVHMLWATATPPTDIVWINGEGKGNSERARKVQDLRLRLAGPYTANIGTLDPERSGMRCYVKNTDSIAGGPRTKLPDRLHRARLERRLMGPDVPFTTITSWREFKFEHLAPLFAQVRIAPEASPMLRTILELWTAQLGIPDDDYKRQAHRRLTRPHVVRDSEVNETIRVALRRLTTAQRRSRRLKEKASESPR